jgi:ATP-binding cassette subfamily B protein
MVGIGLVESVLADDRAEPEQSGQVPASTVGLPIQFKNVDFAYQPGAPVLKNFNLDIKPGEMVALVGPSGAGKSTVFSLLLRFYEYQGGAIEIGGKNLETLSLQSLRSSISYVGQSNFIFGGSLRENLTLGADHISDEALIDACKAVGLYEHIVTLKRGFDAPMGELGSLISGGQAQRLNIARAILKDAPILLLDEVTSALDAENEELIRSYMHSQVGKKTVLVIAHRLSTIRQADKIALVEAGQVQAFGSHHDLIKRNEYYERVATLQLMS